GLVLVGAAGERERSDRLGRFWSGPVANLCGFASPRVSAAAMRRARMFIGHDSGPMHLAAAVGTRCVAIFSPKNRPGEWYPFGDRHKILYPSRGADSIRAIPPGDVIAAAEDVLRNAEEPLPVTGA